MGLSDGRKSVRIGLAVLIQYRSVTDTQPATQPASYVAVAITLNAQASSLMNELIHNMLTIYEHRLGVVLHLYFTEFYYFICSLLTFYFILFPK